MSKYNTIAVIAAMDEEIRGLRDKMDDATAENVSGIEITIGHVGEKKVIAAKCGIGKVFAAMCAQTLILKYSPDCVINTGSAGGIGSGVGLLDVVVADYVVQHDMDTSPLGDPVGLVSGINVVKFPVDEEVSEVLYKATEVTGTGRHRGTIATGDKFIASKDDADRIRNLFGASACEMEAGAIAQVCYVNKMPYGIIRAISDGGNDDSKMDFPTFLVKAGENSIKTVLRFIELI